MIRQGLPGLDLSSAVCTEDRNRHKVLVVSTENFPYQYRDRMSHTGLYIHSAKPPVAEANEIIPLLPENDSFEI
jgi:hypothetical protein